MINRIIKKSILSTQKSVILLGPRQVGKSTLMSQISVDLEINLADELEYLNFSSRPEHIKELVELNNARSVFIDEIQRIPKLLNTIQTIVDKNKKIKFYLTGSSAIKLKRGGANLLPGRMVNFQLGPICAKELNYEADTKKILEYGSLPEVYLSNNEKENQRILKSYAANYIKEEIKAEAIVRQIDAFARFFQESFKHVGQFIDYTKLSKNSKVSRHAIPNYFEILEDSMIGFRVYSYQSNDPSLDLIKHPKFYLFDNGAYNGLQGNFVASPDRSGVLSEQLVYSQLRHSAYACEEDIDISHFRTRSDYEVDFIVKYQNETFAIEVKNNDDMGSSDTHGLMFFSEIEKCNNLFIFHMGKKEKKLGKVWSLPWQKGLQEMKL